jgi:hypothetical protein
LKSIGGPKDFADMTGWRSGMLDRIDGKERMFETVITLYIGGFILVSGLIFFFNSNSPCYSADSICGPIAGEVGILLLVVGTTLLLVGLLWAIVVPRYRGPLAKIS